MESEFRLKMQTITNWVGIATLSLATAGWLVARPDDGVVPAAASTAPAAAELPKMITDRPDFTEATEVVGKGVVQMENGLTVERDKGRSTLTCPEMLMRIGLSNRLEFRIGGDGFLSELAEGAERVSGYSDVELGMKIRLWDEGRRRPAFSLIPILSIPTGSREFSSGDYDPTLKLALGKDLPRGFALGGNLNLSYLTTPDGRFFQTAYSATVGHKVIKSYSGYWEIFGFAPREKGGSASWIANTGISRSIGKNAQVDVRIGKHLTGESASWFWGVGVAFRQPLSMLFSGGHQTPRREDRGTDGNGGPREIANDYR
jgi:hypothetical protein